jgi:co-chaperonin GroES (HSP10)
MIKIKPEGAMLIVLPLPKEEKETDSGITVMDFALLRGEILEVSDEWADKYKPGEVVLFAETAGKTLHYQKKSCLWISGIPYTENGDVWAKVIEN